MYKDTDIELKGKQENKCAHGLSQKVFPFLSFVFIITCVLFLVLSFSCPEDVTFTVHWYLKYYPCHNEFNNIEVSA